jgi:hypothetical protein
MVGKLLLAGAIAVPTVATGTIAATGVAVVDVREGGPDGHRFVLPVPLVLAELAASFVPEKELNLDLPPEARGHLRSAGGILKALSEAPDGEYVRVEDENELVVIEKRGDTLHVEVHGRNEDVSVNVPLDALSEVVGEDGRLSPRRAVRLLRHARFTTLVDVRDGEDRVKVTVF